MTDSPPEPSPGDPFQSLSKLLTPGQAAQLEAALFEVRRSGGFGRVYIDMRGGMVRFIGWEIRKVASV